MPTVAHDLLFAEAEALPFTLADDTEWAYGHELARGPGGLEGRTRRLAQALEERLRPNAAGLSLLGIAQLRDRAWFAAEPGPSPSRPPSLSPSETVPLHEHLTRVARRYLESEGYRITLRADGAWAEHASEWRWLSLLLPADLLVAALGASEGIDPVDDHVSLVSHQLLQVLREPVADTHLHRGAAFSFALLWTAMMRNIASNRPPLKANFETHLRGERVPFGSGGALYDKIYSAAIARTLLASFLWQLEERRVARVGAPGAPWRLDDGRACASFADFGRDGLADIAARVAGGNGAIFGAASDGPRGRTAQAESVRAQLMRVVSGLFPETAAGAGGLAPSAAWPSLYRQLIGVGWPEPASVDEIADADPLAAWLPKGPGLASPETRFVMRAIGHLSGPGAADADFARIFWQYVRVRCAVFRFLTHEPGVSGLDWFGRHFRRIWLFRGGLDDIITHCALDHHARDLHLGSLEARTSPPASEGDLCKDLRRVVEQAASYEPPVGQGRPEVALVLHFLKERSRDGREHDSPADPFFGCRQGRWFKQRSLEAKAIEDVLERRPEALAVLRGLDVCNDELAQPTWVLVPLVGRVREYSARVAAQLARKRPTWMVPRLRVTVHVGEDYGRLVEGLRRVHEAIEFGLVGSGDRLGHGLALGDAPVRLSRGAHRVSQPALERLDDLLWELDRLGCSHLPPRVDRSQFLFKEIARLSATIYRYDGGATPLDPWQLVHARRMRHDPAVLSRLGFPDMLNRSPPPAEIDDLVWRYLTDPLVYERGRRPVEVVLDEGELAMLEAAQSWLRGEVARREITVESNPSSNLLIANYVELDEHPAFRLFPLPGRGPPAPGEAVLLSVNVDDPITFASRLSDEYAYLYFSLLRQGVPSQDALRWLEQVRQNGWRSRFSLPVTADRESLQTIAAVLGARPTWARSGVRSIGSAGKPTS